MSQTLRSPGAGAEVTLPDGWEILPDQPPGTAAAREPVADEGFRANLVLTRADNAEIDFRDWQVATDELLPRMLNDYLLLDLERCEVAGRPGGRRLAHHVTPDGVAVTMEQWFTSADGVGHTLTATIDSWRYDAVAAAWASVAAGLRLVDGAAS